MSWQLERRGCWILTLFVFGSRLPVQVFSKSLILKSPVLHNFGTWGEWDECPPGTYAVGFQLKVDCVRTIPELNSGYDDTALNGIRLTCSKIGENTFHAYNPSSTVGQYGRWYTTFYCDLGVIAGFQLKSSEFVPLSNNVNNFGAINFKAYCISSGNRQFWLEGDGRTCLPRPFTHSESEGLKEWTEMQKCGNKQAIRAIRTQVDRRPKNVAENDIEGLVNIQMRCDEVDSDVSTCKPKVYYQLLQECNNLAGREEFDCSYETKVGTEMSKINSRSSNARSSIMSSLGLNLEASAGIVTAKLGSKLGMGSESGSSSTSSSSAFWTNEELITRKILLPPNSIARFFQVVWECADVISRSVHTITDSRIGDFPKPIPPTGFICEKPDQRRMNNMHGKQRYEKRGRKMNLAKEEF